MVCPRLFCMLTCQLIFRALVGQCGHSEKAQNHLLLKVTHYHWSQVRTFRLLLAKPCNVIYRDCGRIRGPQLPMPTTHRYLNSRIDPASVLHGLWIETFSMSKFQKYSTFSKQRVNSVTKCQTVNPRIWRTYTIMLDRDWSGSSEVGVVSFDSAPL